MFSSWSTFLVLCNILKRKKKHNFDGSLSKDKPKTFVWGFFLNFNRQELERIKNKVGRVCRKRNVARVFTAFFSGGVFISFCYCYRY
jgi:hypothetical protein